MMVAGKLLIWGGGSLLLELVNGEIPLNPPCARIPPFVNAPHRYAHGIQCAWFWNPVPLSEVFPQKGGEHDLES